MFGNKAVSKCKANDKRKVHVQNGLLEKLVLLKATYRRTQGLLWLQAEPESPMELYVFLIKALSFSYLIFLSVDKTNFY